MQNENPCAILRKVPSKYFRFAGTAYDIFCEELETSLSVVFGGKAAQPETTLNDEHLLLRSTIFAAVNKIYLDCCFDALRQEQALWSDILPDLA